MKNLALIASILTLINCTTTSNFSKRKYTNGRMQSSLTTTKYNKSIQEKSIQKSGNRDTATSKHVKNKETTEIITLEKAHIKKYRERLNFLNDKDSFSLTN